MRRIATQVVVVQALKMIVLMYAMGRGQVVSRGPGEGSPETYVLMVPTVMLTRKLVSGRKLTKLLAMMTIELYPIQKGLIKHGKPKCGMLEIGIGVFTNRWSNFIEHINALV